MPTGLHRLKILLLALTLPAGGCTVLRVHVLQQAPVIAPAHESEPSPAGKQLALGFNKKLSRTERLQALTGACRLALPGSSRGVAPDLAIYNAALAQVVRLLSEKDFANEAGITVLRTKKDILDPSTADSLIPAETVSIRGLASRSTQPGLGISYSAGFRHDSPALQDQPGIPRIGMEIPVTAVLTFPSGRAQLEFRRTLDSDSLRIGGRRVQLAADFSAPLALLISRGKNRAIDLSALLFSDRNISRAGLLQFQAYDPDKIPVIFVHGLLSRPEAWLNATNTLLGDPLIRQKYQFWFYLYPTGLPVWQSAALLRSEIDRFRTTLSPSNKFGEIILVGHSMGGLISSLLVRSGGEPLWGQFSDTSPMNLNLSSDSRDLINKFIYFTPRKDVSRVIYVATPHRGSGLALNPIISLTSHLVRLPFRMARHDRLEILSAIRDDARSAFVAPANSIRFLRANSPLLLSILNLPMRPIPYHSIIGDRGRGDTPNSSDGVVPYWSSHLPSAASEKIVPSGHGANEHPAGIEEIRRILREAAL